MCKSFAPEYEKIADRLSEQTAAAGGGAVMVGKIDATTNEVDKVCASVSKPLLQLLLLLLLALPEEAH